MTSPSMANTSAVKNAPPNPLHDPVIDLHIRVGRLEDAFLSQKGEQLAMKSDMALMTKDIGYIKAGQDKLYAGINRILWAIGLIVLTAVAGFILNGGLAVLPIP